ENLRRELNQLKENAECRPWREWHIQHEWPEHIQRLNGLIDPKHLNNVAVVLDVPPRDLEELNKQANAEPEEFSRKPSDFAEKAYTADVLIRGIYYDELARSTGHQIVHHRIRRGVFSGLDSNPKEMPIPLPIGYLHRII